MSNLVFRLPRYYQDSPQVSELERVLGEQAEALRVSESDTLAQLWIDTATWGLDLWEQWVGLPADRTRPYSYRAAWWPPSATTFPRSPSWSTRRSINLRLFCPIWPASRRM
ncbi:Uncharacterized protein conserved in bacteria (DUF2313) [Flavonifractor plautii]|uniref:Uncharacterized protein conserved in bacteria (DUF2313) n=1 Tax=Flavonifractor plautii TaxID=292800 RepID=A0A174USU1_FLAPL|nr:Uncharacterized protein conserved in bacteria (DUF2313) [Flavonifractor plautii]